MENLCLMGIKSEFGTMKKVQTMNNVNTFFFFWSCVFFRAAPVGYGGSQARG